MDWKTQVPNVDFEQGQEAGAVRFDDEESADASRPRLIYLTTAADRLRSKMNVVEGTVLVDERVATAAKFFDCYQLDGDSIERDHPLYEKINGRQLPRFVAIGSDGKVHGKLEGKVSPSRLYSMLKGVADREYATGGMDRLVKKHRDMLNRLDRLTQKKQTLAAREKKSEGRETREIRSLREQIRKEESSLAEFETELWDVDRRTASR